MVSKSVKAARIIVIIMFEEGQEILDKRYRVLKKLGGGAFGEIFKGKFLA